MDENLKNQIELEVRRVLSSEASEYRNYLQNQFQHLKWGIGLIVIASSIIFVFIFGKTAIELDDYAKAQVSDRVVDYKVKKEVQDRLNTIINSETTSDDTKARIRDIAYKLSNEVMSNEVVKKLNEAVDDKLKKINVIREDELLGRLPVGSIISSISPPEKFSNLIGETDFAIVKWVLADGRAIPGSKYSTLIGTTVPDLRGMFLRGLNAGRNDGKEDPDGVDRVPGSYQGDTLKEHSHDYKTAGFHYRSFKGDDGRPRPVIEGAGKTDFTGDLETRPKNVAVYFYIKIN